MLGAMTSHLEYVTTGLPEDCLVFSDVDNTLLSGASVYLFGLEAWRQGFISWRHVLPALIDQRHFVRTGENERRMANTRERALALVAGRTMQDFLGVAHSAWENRMRSRLFPEMVNLLTRHRDRGHRVLLATASPTELGEVIASGMGVDGALGTRLARDGDVFTGAIEGDLLHGPKKAEAALALAHQLGVPSEQLVAYSDSAADLPLLEGVGHPVAVNPDTRLYQVATDRNWPIIWPGKTARHLRHRL